MIIEVLGHFVMIIEVSVHLIICNPGGAISIRNSYVAYTEHTQLRPGTESVDYSVAAKTISFSDKRAGNDIQDILKDKEAERHSLGGL